MLFSSVGQNIRGRLVTCSDDNIRLKLLFGSYIPRRRLESVIAKYSKHPHHCCHDWQQHIHLKTLDSLHWSHADAQPHARTEDNFSSTCNSRFLNRDGDKEAKLMDCSFKLFRFYHKWQKNTCKNNFQTFLPIFPPVPGYHCLDKQIVLAQIEPNVNPLINRTMFYIFLMTSIS